MCNDLFFFLSLIIGLFLICTLLPVFNVQSESRCPPYTKKRLIPDSTVISTRHASLRSAKKLIETRGTSVDVAQMKKASEDENPVANHSVQMEEHNAFEAQFIPFGAWDWNKQLWLVLVRIESSQKDLLVTWMPPFCGQST